MIITELTVELCERETSTKHVMNSALLGFRRCLYKRMSIRSLSSGRCVNDTSSYSSSCSSNTSGSGSCAVYPWSYSWCGSGSGFCSLSCSKSVSDMY